ncbi:MAG TPA: succinate dehydrogenase, hydrophobic membrane anchor protein [Methylophilaceae bacterium]|jgi:succinate dehydrogenase / fumarate reductase membrane anchor subunit
MVMRILSAHYHGMRDWLLQRGTAVVMAVYSVLLAVMILQRQPSQYETWKELFVTGWMRVATLLFLVALFVHAWLGIKDILIDYVKPRSIHLALKAATAVSLLIYTAWAVKIVWSI